jgi:hypothetical protein
MNRAFQAQQYYWQIDVAVNPHFATLVAAF